MSVQAGIWNFDDKPVDRKLIDDLSEALKQQGPDGESRYVDRSVALVYRPFHTTAESRREKQPYVSRRGLVLTWDGRLDNREVLLAELRSELESSPTDVAIFAAAFDRWDTDCFRRIVGDWAVSIWKPEQRELLFAADYMGIRHIFYHLKNDRIWWSTDLSPLVLLSGDNFHIDDDYIAGYFAHDPDAHLTPYREIREVPPGQFVRIRNGRVSVDRFWRFSPKSRIRYRADAEYEEHFRHVFRQSVQRRLRSDSRVLAELSGGLDSSSIVCMADDILVTESAQTPGLDTLSYYDNTEPSGDDWIYLQRIEQKRGRAGAHIDGSKTVACEGSLRCLDALPGASSLGQKHGDERADAVRGGAYRAVLSGIGGDEFMGGVPDPRAHLADFIMQVKFVTLARQLMAWSLVKRRPWVQLLWQSAVVLLPASLGQYLAKPTEVEPWIERDFSERTRLRTRLLGRNEDFGFWLPTRRSYVNGVVLMGNKLAKRTPPTLALEESRYPYLDQNLVEFILSIPATQLLRPGERRSLMRRSLAGIVPQEILERRTKQFAARTLIMVLEKNLDQLQRLFDAPLTSRLGYVNQSRFMDSLHAARNGKEVAIVHLMDTIALELWLRDFACQRLIDPAMTTWPNVAALSQEANA